MIKVLVDRLENRMTELMEAAAEIDMANAKERRKVTEIALDRIRIAEREISNLAAYINTLNTVSKNMHEIDNVSHNLDRTADTLGRF